MADSQLPQCRVLSETVVDDEGRYLEHLTNIFPDGVRTLSSAGTWHVQNGLLVATMTNDLTHNTLVPRLVGISKIVRLDERELVVTDTNNGCTEIYKKSDR